MSETVDSITAIVQLLIAAIVSLYLLQVFSLFPEELISGPFSNVIFLLQTLPWIIVAMAVLALITMILEVLD